MSKPTRLFFLLLLLALILRFFLTGYSFQFRENTDVLRWRDWGRIAYLHGLADTYKTDHLTFGTLPNNMPPGTLYIVKGMYDANILASKMILKTFGVKEGSLEWMNGAMLNFFLRLPSIVADLLIGYIIYFIVKSKTNEKRALIGSSLFLFNPVVFYNSAFWGQMDSLNNVFALLAIIFIIYNQNFKSIFFYLMSLFVKLSLIIYAPAFFILLLKKNTKKIKNIFLSFLLAIIAILIFILPLSMNPLSWVSVFLMKNGVGEMENITNFAFNFWWFIYNPWISSGNPSSLFSFSEVRLIDSPLDTTLFMGISLFYWSIFLFIITIIPLLYRLYKDTKKQTQNNIFLIFALIGFLAFLLLPRMHERYMYPMFPLLATFIGLQGKFIFIYFLLSFLNLINLYVVWHPMELSVMPYSLMNNQTFQWTISAITVLVGLIWYIKSLSLLRNGKKK